MADWWGWDDDSIDALEEEIEQELRRGVDQVADRLQELWQEKALATRSYRTGAYHNSIHVSRRDWLEADERLWEIEADVSYAMIIEVWLPPVPGYLSAGKRRGRYPAKLAIEAVEDEIPMILESLDFGGAALA